MKKTTLHLRKALTGALDLFCVLGIFLGSAELPDGGCDFYWTLGCIAFSLICAGGSRLAATPA